MLSTSGRVVYPTYRNTCDHWWCAIRRGGQHNNGRSCRVRTGSESDKFCFIGPRVPREHLLTLMMCQKCTARRTPGEKVTHALFDQGSLGNTCDHWWCATRMHCAADDTTGAATSELGHSRWIWCFIGTWDTDGWGRHPLIFVEWYLQYVTSQVDCV